MFSLKDKEGNRKTYGEIFVEYYPYYLSYGISEAEYWDGDSEITRAYRKAFELKRQYDNEKLWLQGLYIYRALESVFPLFNPLTKEKVKSYIEKPIPLTEEAIDEQKETQAKEGMNKGLDFMIHFTMARNNNKKEGESDGK